MDKSSNQTFGNLKECFFPLKERGKGGIHKSIDDRTNTSNSGCLSCEFGTATCTGLMKYVIFFGLINYLILIIAMKIVFFFSIFFSLDKCR